MEVSIKTIPEFDRRAKRLAKKYTTLKHDLQKLTVSIMENPLQGITIGQRTHKIRMAITSKGGGKSGGARILTYVLEEKTAEQYEVTLLTIYDKSEIENVSDSYIASLVAEVEQNFNTSET